MTEWIDPLVLFTIVLAAATTYYAWMTRKLAVETKLSRETQQKQYSLEIKPSLKVSTRWHGVTLLPSIMNIGRTPAIDLELSVSITYKDVMKNKPLQPLKVKCNLLMPNEKIPFYVPNLRYGEIRDNCQSLSLTGICRDIDGNAHNINDTLFFDLPADNEKPEEGMWLILPDDEPLIQMKKQIKTTGDEIKRELSDLIDKIRLLGPIVDGRCNTCGKYYSIDTRESHRCPDCGNELLIR